MEDTIFNEIMASISTKQTIGGSDFERYKNPPPGAEYLSSWWSLIEHDSVREYFTKKFNFIPKIVPCKYCLAINNTIGLFRGKLTVIEPSQIELFEKTLNMQRKYAASVLKSKNVPLPNVLVDAYDDSYNIDTDNYAEKHMCMSCVLQFFISTDGYKFCIGLS
eukprot:171671_1